MGKTKRRTGYRPKPHQTPTQGAEKRPLYGDYRPARPCRCGKSGWTTRADARAVLRQMRRRVEHPELLDIYRCRADDTHYHIGNHRAERGVNLNDPGAWVEPDDQPPPDDR